MVEAKTSPRTRSTRKNPARRASQTRPVDQPTPKQKTLHQLRRETKGLRHPEWQPPFAEAFDDRNIPESEKALLAVFQRLVREEHGLDTPIETFITNLVLACAWHPLTLEDVYRELRELELNWNDAVAIARKFCTEYSDLIPPGTHCGATPKEVM